MKKLANLKPGAYFFYGGVQWVVLENNDKIGATLSIAAEPVFNRAFDEENRNDWRVSSLRRELNGPFFDALIAEGANRAAFLDWESDLTADDGMTDYGTATDKIALLSDGLYRKYRQYIPLVDDWCWTLTPWTCNPSYSCNVRYVNSSGAMDWYGAYYGNGGARPLCYLESSIFVSVPYEDETADPRADMIEEARDAVLEVLSGYNVKWIRFIRFSCDQIPQIEAIERAAELLEGYGKKPYNLFIYLLVTKDVENAAYRVERLKRLKGISIYAQAERNDRKGIIPNALQKEFAQRFVYGRCYLKESWEEYLTRHKEKRLQI